MNINDLVGRKVGMCVSGGLDSKTVTHVLLSAGVDVLCFTADLGQPDEDDISGVVEKMAPAGAETIVVDLREEMARGCFDVIKAQATYDGGYWNTTGIGRAVMLEGLINAMKEHGCNVLSHGATGRGNDQLRFERYTNVFDPDMDVYAPWRDAELLKKFPGRTEMVAYLAEQGIEAEVGNRKRYSTDGNLAGLSHEAEDLEELDTSCQIVDPIMGVWPEQAPDEVEIVTLSFEKGECVAINGDAMGPLKAMETANDIAGRNGIWMRNALENRVIGTKSRGVYEAPGMELLGFGLANVYQATLDRRAGALMAHLSDLVSNQIYDGRYFDPATTAAMAAIDTFAEHATAKVELGLYKGNMYSRALTDCPASLYFPEHASMEASDGLNPVSSQGFVEVQSVEAKALAHAGQIRK
ncbi:MAG: argininosuccinate synthase [Alphaproteobacteria bacterium]|nr:MAG: argininosuccinate synthase [Alphaproteobacteria bacterium]